MKLISKGNIEIELYASIHELPINRYRALQQYLLQDSGIGSSMADVDTRLNNIITLLANDKKEDAINEAANLRYTFFTMLSQTNYKALAFACLIKRMNNVLAEDLSGEGLQRVVDQISQMSIAELDEVWDEVKKKLIPNSNFTSPSYSEAM
jgi:hypothetical protein